MNNVNLIGRLARDIELKQTQTGSSFAIFTLVVDKGLSKDKKKEAEAKGYPTADFISCKVWGKQAEVMNQYAVKGQKIGVSGSIETSNYEDKDGNKRYNVLVSVQKMELLEKPGNSGGSVGQGTSDTHGYQMTDSDIPF